MKPGHDLAIIGGGPSGLAAAIYAAREYIDTTIYEKDVIIGGLAAITDKIENYPGFPDGIGGIELAEALEKQAKRFGTKVETGKGVTSLRRREQLIELSLGSETRLVRAALITTGNHYRRLEVLGEAEYIGKGVHFCATCDGPIYGGKTIIVVGGGNSAMQEGLFLAKFASRIIMLVRGDELKGSPVLAEKVKAHPKFEIHYRRPVTAVTGNGSKATGVEAGGQSFEADGIFVFIGLIPNTQWLEGTIELDAKGFIKADNQYKTSLEGVFAAGDVRSGSSFQIASAVGEGVEAALAIRDHLGH